MNIFYVSILYIAIILCYIDFFYILKNNVYFLEKGPDRRRRKANKRMHGLISLLLQQCSFCLNKQ